MTKPSRDQEATLSRTIADAFEPLFFATSGDSSGRRLMEAQREHAERWYRYGWNACIEHERARTQRLFEALKSVRVDIDRRMNGDDDCGLPFDEDLADAMNTIDEALKEGGGEHE